MDAKKALALLKEAKDYWDEIYKALRDDVRFSIGLDHWTATEEKKLGKNNCMIVPILPQFIHQVMNDMRQNTPSIDVLPGEGISSDPETAKIFKGLIRNIEYKSRADEVYDTAGEYAVRGGLGFARVDHDYASEDSFLQELKLRRVQNPESIYLDPNYVECDGSDAEWGIILDTIDKADFEKAYPKKSFTSFDDLPTDSKADKITIAELFIKEYTDIPKQMAADGSLEDYVDDGDKKKKKRTLRKVTIGRYKLSGADVLEDTTFPGKYIPIAAFHGEEVWVNGKRYLLSLIRLAKDAQRRVNKWAVKESQILDMAPVAPIIAPIGSVENIPDGWTSPDDTMVLRYRMVDSAGNKLDKPERLAPPPIPTGIINAMEGAKQSVKEALGMYNASIGQKSNAISGVAYDAQKTEADVATSHFGDNAKRSIQYLGRILVCAIPEVYDTARVIQIIGPEEEPQMVGINGAQRQPGQEQEHDLTKGMYDVRVTTGASYTTKRQEAAALFGDVLKQQPALMGVIGDLWAKNLDVAGAESMAARIRKTIPKELTAEEDAKKDGQEPPDPEKMQMAQMIQQIQAQMQEMGAELQSKQADEQNAQDKNLLDGKKLDLESRKLDLESQKLEIESFRAKSDFVTAQNPPPVNESAATKEPTGMHPDMSGDELMMMAQGKKQKEQQAEAAEQERQVNEYALNAQKAEEDRREKIVKAHQMETLIATIHDVAVELHGLKEAVLAPKSVQRDSQGVITGVN